ncbi:MAG TPA: alkaline phosphatase [Chthoniobacteraceae bacterium]
MKLRNQLLALFCLLLFAGVGVLYFRVWVVQKPFGIIVFVSDGMVTRHLTAARLYQGGADHRLILENMPNLALVANYARDFSVPDAAAAATALATGVKVSHRHLAIGSGGESLQTIVDLAQDQGRAIGIVTTGQLTDPTPAAFYAHHGDSRNVEEIAAQFISGRRIDVALGGGAADFLPPEKGGRRRDGRDLLAELKQQGRELISSKAELESAAVFRTEGLLGFFAPRGLAFRDEIEAAQQQPSLSDMVRRAVQFLQQNRTGYLLIVDSALVTRAAELNQGERVLEETLALDHAVGTAMKYAGEKSLILAVGKHATGGMTLNGYPTRLDHGVALLGTTAAGYPSITWATGPNGATPPAANEPTAYQTPSALNTAEDVIAVGQGSGSEKLRGFIDNTAIFRILRDAL